MSNKIDLLLKQMAESTTEVVGIIHDIDVKITGLEVERQAIGDAPLSQDEFLGHIAASIDRQTDRFSSFMMSELQQMKRSFFATDNSSAFPQLLTHDAGLPVVITEEACLWYLKPAIMARMKELTSGMDFPSSDVAIPVEKRREEIAEIDAKIVTLRAERNRLSSQLQELGIKS